MQDNTLIAAQLREHRRAKGWTQPQLAEKSGVSLRAVQDAESGKRRTQPGNLFALRKALGIEGDPDETRSEWSADVQVFLDVMGAFLSSMPEAERMATIREITTRIVASR